MCLEDEFILVRKNHGSLVVDTLVPEANSSSSFKSVRRASSKLMGTQVALVDMQHLAGSLARSSHTTVNAKVPAPCSPLRRADFTAHQETNRASTDRIGCKEEIGCAGARLEYFFENVKNSSRNRVRGFAVPLWPYLPPKGGTTNRGISMEPGDLRELLEQCKRGV